VPSGELKDHQFISKTLNALGIGFDGDISKHPSIGDWADPNTYIPNWPVVDGPVQAGDVLATSRPIPRHWYFSPGQSIGIATGDGTSLGIRDNNRIEESDHGLNPDHDPTIRRYAQLAANTTLIPPDPAKPLTEPPKDIHMGENLYGSGSSGQQGTNFEGGISGIAPLPNGGNIGTSVKGNQDGVTSGGVQYQSPGGTKYEVGVDQGPHGIPKLQLNLHTEF
jgi:hypothetical protein